MSKSLALVALLGAGIAYFVFKKKEIANPTSPVSSPSNYQPSQPSQMYPWSPIVPPRVDNKNQPWYNGPALPQGPSGFQEVAGAIQAGSSIVHSLSDVWGDMSNWFGSDDPGANLEATDDWWSNATHAEGLELMDSYEYDNSWDVSDADAEWEYV